MIDAELEAAISDLAEAAFEVAESLKHAKHAAKLEPIRTDATVILQRYFRRQKRLFLKQIDGHLRILGADTGRKLQEGEKPEAPLLREPSDHGEAVTLDANYRTREADSDAKTAVKSVLPDGYAMPLTLTGGMSTDYSKALTAALEAGYDVLADQEGIVGKEIAEDVVETYLRDHSLTKLTGNFDATTVERLRNALADAYEAGEDYDGMVEAVTEEYAGFSSVRAGMIAQTEMNGAYNAGRKQLGVDLGFNEKSWNPDGEACPICLENVASGWIAMDDEFPSGDDAPTAHPNCDCSLDVRFNADAD